MPFHRACRLFQGIICVPRKKNEAVPTLFTYAIRHAVVSVGLGRERVIDDVV